MRRSILLPLSLLLAVLTAVAMLGAGLAMTDFTPNRLPGNGQAVHAVQRFYNAVNATLQTGDPSLLDRVVAPEFVDHTTRPGLEPTRAGLARYVVGLHAAVPTLRLAVAEVIAGDDRITARLRVEGVEGIAFLNVSGAAVWGPLDVFRVAGSQIVEHRGRPDVAVRWEPLFATPLVLLVLNVEPDDSEV